MTIRPQPGIGQTQGVRAPRARCCAVIRDPIRGLHQGQRLNAATTGRTHDCTRPSAARRNPLRSRGRPPVRAPTPRTLGAPTGGMGRDDDLVRSGSNIIHDKAGRQQPSLRHEQLLISTSCDKGISAPSVAQRLSRNPFPTPIHTPLPASTRRRSAPRCISISSSRLSISKPDRKLENFSLSRS